MTQSDTPRKAGGLMSGPPQRRSAVSLGVAPRRALVMGSRLSSCSIRFFLFADVWADLLQLEPDGGHGVTTGPAGNAEVLGSEMDSSGAPG
jgi:hypothetical protein